ncbi:hypothetical protein ABBQ38_004481 [Trebouxia sp. C0009 RCD-2024]
MRRLLGHPMPEASAATKAAVDAVVTTAADASHTDSETLPGYSWWPRQRSIVAFLILVHVAALLYWLYQVLRKATLDASENKRKALMEPPKKVTCSYEWSNLPGTKLSPYNSANKLVSRTNSWSQLLGESGADKAAV